MIRAFRPLFCVVVLLAVFVLPVHAAHVVTPDGAKIFYEEQGKGKTILLVHGWQCSGKFWQKNVPELAKNFRVITVDLRGHGNSSKILSGHTIHQYATDIRTLIETLQLRNVTLAGWSLGGPVVLTYWHKYTKDSRLSGIVLVDTPPAPMHSGAWNSHGLRGNNWAGYSKALDGVMNNREASTLAFIKNMFHGADPPESDIAWIKEEVMKTPSWVAVGIGSDLYYTDAAQYLSSVAVPTLVFAADSNFYKKGIEMGRWIAAQIKNSTFVPVPEAGHILFYEKPAVFNKAVTEFVNKGK